ncbi:hypothetical protein ACFSDD_17590 [Salipiger marinus]|uniref:hypothetical protein n=1 Tax=Salipiger marinus TaxID=555512 RepID=UPI002CF69603|nr:hypothetical protein [Salipiger manganoxidans]MEB3421753.1 hypothetical protein [Salipiger manganoxidans]
MPQGTYPSDPVAFLTDPEAAAANRVWRQDCWLMLKARQGHPIEREAGNRLNDLEERITGRSMLAHVATDCDPDPLPPAPAMTEVEAARRRAEPAIFRAIAALGMGHRRGSAA